MSLATKDPLDMDLVPSNYRREVELGASRKRGLLFLSAYAKKWSSKVWNWTCYYWSHEIAHNNIGDAQEKRSLVWMTQIFHARPWKIREGPQPQHSQQYGLDSRIFGIVSTKHVPCWIFLHHLSSRTMLEYKSKNIQVGSRGSIRISRQRWPVGRTVGWPLLDLFEFQGAR